MAHLKPTDPRFQDLEGQEFGHLTVEHFLGKHGHKYNCWFCRCRCGGTTSACGADLVSGHTVSCGCRRAVTTRELFTTHGLRNSPEYAVWNSMIGRCCREGPNGKNYKDRGVTVCRRWRKFIDFYTDMGPRPSPCYTLERNNNDRGYCPSNCRWATRTDQNRNRRINKMLTLGNKTQCQAAWAEELGISDAALAKRFSVLGWSVEKALTTPKYART